MRLGMVAAPREARRNQIAGWLVAEPVWTRGDRTKGLIAQNRLRFLEHETGGFLVVCCVRVPEKRQGYGSGSEGSKELIMAVSILQSW